MNAIKELNEMIGAESAMNRYASARADMLGIAVGTDKNALGWRVANCIARVAENNVRIALGQVRDYQTCGLCGERESICACEYLRRDGIDPSSMRIENGYVHYESPKRA